jgi:ParB-like nuclease domain
MDAANDVWAELRFSGLEQLPIGTISISELVISNSPRLSGKDDKHIRILAESDSQLPPILVHRSTMRVIDGVHRVHAAKLRSEHQIQARLFDGDEPSSFVLAVHTNTTHGLPLSIKDRKAAAERILRYFPHWSDRAVGSVTGLAHRTVASVRAYIPEQEVQAGTRTGRDGRRRPRDNARRREIAARVLSDNPGASLREIAAKAEISPETARRIRRELATARPAVLASDNGTVPTGKQGPHRYADPRGSWEDGARAWHSLRADPAFRSTNDGRSLLRMLSVFLLLQSRGEQLVAGVPAHCITWVAGSARANAQAWLDFAERVEKEADMNYLARRLPSAIPYFLKELTGALLGERGHKLRAGIS